ncbi:MAG TPA: D-alanyl-lipoteichoic acid biosynthesis protein DltD [Bacteroidales bacterium]|nr:D-alanyl-lipoteichoic acid biosynthesis protein DltD [Bacteroidales bacterium]
MKLLEKIYKTSNLFKNGIFIVITLIILILLGYLIPNQKPESFEDQIYTLNGFNAKYNDEAEVTDFFISIKKNRGYLVMGTSETVSMEEGNYHDFLNEDPDLKDTKFSVLAGAGRTCGTYIPLFLHHAEDLDSLQLIYFINPAYWRTNLCEMNLKYWNRYTQYQICRKLTVSESDQKQIFQPVNHYMDKLSFFQKGIAFGEYVVRDIRRNYFCDLRNLLFPSKYGQQFQFITDTLSDYRSCSKYGSIDTELIDTVWNVLKTFQHKEWYQPMNETDTYRDMELTSIIQLCKKLGIKATFVIGPYNERFIQQYNPESLAGHQRVVQKIKQLLIDQNVPYIDATELSPVAGAFVDHQHYSSYGAYRIYQLMKQKLYEEKNH